MLSNIRIVLVGTTHPGNIGAAARAMRNMGLSDLALVAPKIYPSEQATARAAGADDVLAAAGVYDSLREAIADCRLIVGASARSRAIPWPQLTPRECADLAGRQPADSRTAILFGREHSGLTNEELERCHFLLHIPSNPEFSSLNVAAAVQLVAYELFLMDRGGEARAEPATQLATAAELESFFGHLEATLWDIGFLHERKPGDSTLRRLRRIYNRSGLEQSEIHLLRGILSTMQFRLKSGRE
ncbi:MAG: RNA methyltransferase [Gammaproteobacteria bacterium]|nr:RNA methyltransferase [Gammaproteobacteria bacterium]